LRRMSTTISPPIRVGLIRCDTHGLWYGPQMQQHDSVLLERACTMPEDRQATYSWMTRGSHFFFYSHYSAPRRMTAPRVDGFIITRLWDEHPEVADLASRVFTSAPVVCKTFEEVSDDVDLVFVADCNGDGSDHLALATPGLQKGVPTFIDKPFSNDLAGVQAIRDVADRHAAPVLSLSILQANPATAQFARRLEEVGQVGLGTVTCHSTDPAALIHAICVVHHVFGTGIVTARTVRSPSHTSVHLDYADAPHRPCNGVVLLCGVTPFRFTEMFATAYGPNGSVHGKVYDDFNGSTGSAAILEHIKTWFHTKRTPRIAGEMVEAVAVMDAIRASVRTCTTATVADATRMIEPG